MDLDTTRKKDSYENILNAFEDQEIDILWEHKYFKRFRFFVRWPSRCSKCRSIVKLS